MDPKSLVSVARVLPADRGFIGAGLENMNGGGGVGGPAQVLRKLAPGEAAKRVA